MKKFLSGLTILVGTTTYTYMVYVTATGTGEGLSLSTFVLWAILGWITSFIMLKQGADPAVPIIYSVGATITTILLLLKGRYVWTEVDSFIAILTVICIVLWKTQGSRRALILSVAAGSIAGIPFIILTWQDPANSPLLCNTGFLLANVLAFASAKAWTLEDRLLPTMNIVTGSFMVAPWLF